MKNTYWPKAAITMVSSFTSSEYCPKARVPGLAHFLGTQRNFLVKYATKQAQSANCVPLSSGPTRARHNQITHGIIGRDNGWVVPLRYVERQVRYLYNWSNLKSPVCDNICVQFALHQQV